MKEEAIAPNRAIVEQHPKAVFLITVGKSSEVYVYMTV